MSTNKKSVKEHVNTLKMMEDVCNGCKLPSDDALRNLQIQLRFQTQSNPNAECHRSQARFNNAQVTIFLIDKLCEIVREDSVVFWKHSS